MKRIASLLLVLTLAGCSSTPLPGDGSDPQVPQEDPDFVFVPDVVGLTTEQANVELANAGLLLEVVDTLGEPDDKTVDTQAPPVGSQLPVNGVVEVTAWCFPAPCPDPGEGRHIFDPCTCASR